MRLKLHLSVCLVLICFALPLSAQQAASAAATAVVPPMMKFSGVLSDTNHKPLAGTLGVTFSLYKEAEGGAALWLETQNVIPDKTGHYTVMLGLTTNQGLPAEVFASGEARWLGVQVQGQAEQPRTLLISVPYALKALDAETIGGKPLSALQLAAPNGGPAAPGSHQFAQANTISCASSAGCKKNFVPVFASNGGAATVKDSIIKENGSSVTVNGGVTALAMTATSSADIAISGTSTATNGYGVIGTGAYAGVGANGPFAVVASAPSNGYDGVYATGPTGVFGASYAGSSGYGIDGYGQDTAGVHGGSYDGYGVYGTSNTSTGVYGLAPVGVVAVSNANNAGIYAQSSDNGWAVDAYNVASGTGVLAGSAYGWAAWFNGDVEVDGNLSKGGGSFKIDHPLDPANKYLYHSFVESPDMMNIYNGEVVLDGNGQAVITLPNWFGKLNRDYRYQLTAVGAPAPNLYVAEKVQDNSFKIAGGQAGLEVSWQVTGIRQDAWANAHRIPVEQVKPKSERGFYLHPELYGAPAEKGVLWARAPQAMKRWKEARNNPIANTKHNGGPVPLKP